MKNKKIILIMNIMTPYNIPVYNFLSLSLENFEVFFLAKNESSRKWKLNEKINFKYRILKGLHFYFLKKDWGIHFNWGLFFSLIKARPNLIIFGGYDAPSHWLGLFYCKIFKKKLVLWSGSTLFSSQCNNGIIHWLKKFFIQSANAYLSYGTKAKEYLEFFGAKPEKIINGFNTVDLDYFRQKSLAWRKKQSFEIRRSQYPKYLLIFVGRLIPCKGIRQALIALKELNNKDLGFIIIGHGPEKLNLENYCKKYNLKNIYFTGHKQKHEIAQYYALADFLILPSYREVWGLVINEALASGLFVLASKYAGATHDLIKNKKNGFIIDPANIQDIKNKISKALKFNINKEKISQSMNKFSSENYSKNLLRAIELAFAS